MNMVLCCSTSVVAAKFGADGYFRFVQLLASCCYGFCADPPDFIVTIITLLSFLAEILALEPVVRYNPMVLQSRCPCGDCTELPPTALTTTPSHRSPLAQRASAVRACARPDCAHRGSRARSLICAWAWLTLPSVVVSGPPGPATGDMQDIAPAKTIAAIVGTCVGCVFVTAALRRLLMLSARKWSGDKGDEVPRWLRTRENRNFSSLFTVPRS